MLANAAREDKNRLPSGVSVYVGGAAPPAAVIGALEQIGITVHHLYGLTETYGPSTYCAWRREWDQLPLEERAQRKARQGVRYLTIERLMVANPETLEPCPSDGKTLGEVMLQGNGIMKEYLEDKAETQRAFRGGWYHTGDLAIRHPDGYIEIRDRAKDIIITGGENVSTIEVEDVLYRHPAVLEAAVVAKPDDFWGEAPCAYVTLRPGFENTAADEIVGFCRENLAHFKVPKYVFFCKLPKTATGKIQKYVLRTWAQDNKEQS